MPPKKGADKEHADKKPAKTDKQKKAEAEMMKALATQYNGVLSPDDLKGMKDIFDSYDKKNEGFIKLSLLGNILRTIGFNPIESDVQRAIRDFDPQKTDQIKFPDYVAAVLSIPTSVTDKDIIPAFQKFDPDNRGLLEADEILKSLTNVGEKLDETEATAFKESLTINEHGLFDYNEFFLKFTQPPETKTKKKGKKKKKKK
ncbi:unnamed protein product [Rotaria magnacalcarata]|uniref:EF-hand domain-containing protein n=3 Tax=Rotaria magnacalcarata TaxID=392030 RepID=A0A815UG61_9BILA|nr:unnamed protein product [Rotaria magnacalcarata]CAF1520298.1 unnamed protein product [Rotaria magnacalcarata]CAF2056319.1 unnamed protein product [Rotaria magnacalcarata]CAF2091549.1 unnamed protein product [Rotaria magnacalcarata]CAF2201139.1 unnamed protein product [Rotaria magnacalcarata]